MIDEQFENIISMWVDLMHIINYAFGVVSKFQGLFMAWQNRA